MSEARQQPQNEREYSSSELVRRLLALAWHFRADFLLSLLLSVVLLLLALAGLQFLGVAIDVIRHALDPTRRGLQERCGVPPRHHRRPGSPRDLRGADQRVDLARRPAPPSHDHEARPARCRPENSPAQERW